MSFTFRHRLGGRGRQFGKGLEVKLGPLRRPNGANDFFTNLFRLEWETDEEPGPVHTSGSRRRREGAGTVA